MTPQTVFLFYLSTFWIAFFLCIPIGPVNLEVFHQAVTKRYAHAFSLAIGAACGRAPENSQMQVIIFRWTALAAVSDSAPHAVHDGRRPFGLLQYVGHARPE